MKKKSLKQLFFNIKLMNKDVCFYVSMLIKKNILTLSLSANIFIFVRDNEKPDIPLAHKPLI